MTKTGIIMPMNSDEANLLIISTNPEDATNVVVSTDSTSWDYLIPHGWHLKSIKNVTNLISDGALTGFLWNIITSVLDISIHIIMNACHRDPNTRQDNFNGYGGIIYILNLFQRTIHISRATLIHITKYKLKVITVINRKKKSSSEMSEQMFHN